MNRIRISLGKPTIISQGPAHVRGWGPWQFPNIERLPNRRLHVDYHVEADSALSYGKPVGHAVSADEGMSWEAADEGVTSGILLANGDRLRTKRRSSVPIDSWSLPDPVGSITSYGNLRLMYPFDLAAPPEKDWLMERCAAGTNEWREETAQVDDPGRLLITTEGVVAFPILWRMAIDRDGELWGINYDYSLHSADGLPRLRTVLYRTSDFGKTWRVHCEIFYEGDAEADDQWNKREGFSEPDLAFMPDGSLFCLLRTTDGNGLGPLYWTRSTNGGYTWSKPLVFDNIGVWPVLLTLKCGVTLAAYGRTGLFVRPTADPSGLVWGERTVIVEPGPYQQETCSYAGMIALDDCTALIVYSDFQVPGPDGNPRKSIMARKVHIDVLS